MKADDVWAYWSQVANEAVSEQSRADWLAWVRFRAALLPFD